MQCARSVAEALGKVQVLAPILMQVQLAVCLNGRKLSYPLILFSGPFTSGSAT